LNDIILGAFKEVKIRQRKKNRIIFVLKNKLLYLKQKKNILNLILAKPASFKSNLKILIKSNSLFVRNKRRIVSLMNKTIFFRYLKFQQKLGKVKLLAHYDKLKKLASSHYNKKLHKTTVKGKKGIAFVFLSFRKFFVKLFLF